MPEFFNKRIKTLKHPVLYNDELEKLVKQNSAYTINLFEGDEKMRIEKFACSILQKFKKYNLDRNCVCCMTHGDFRISNVMVREKDGEAVEVVPVDYQLLDCGCPIRDFLYFIFSGTDQKFRRQHMNHLKDLYYDTMTNFLNYFDITAEDVFPRKEFEQMYRERLDYGLLMMIFGAPFLFGGVEGHDVENTCLTDVSFEAGTLFEERVRGLIDDFIEWGFL